MEKCLEGIKVLELSQYISAPYVGQTFADFGAEVYKIETPGEGRGDVARGYDPFYKGMSLYFAAYNRNKNFITLDLKQPKGKEIFLKLVKGFDVLVHNFRPGAMERLGLGYHQLRDDNPGLIMAAISGYGQTGPRAQDAALDMSIQAQCGFMDVTGFPDGPPVKAGPTIVDFIGALYHVIGIMMALQYRQRTGKGQFVDTALFDSMLVMLENYPAIYHATGEVVKRSGNGRPFSSPTGTYLAADSRWVQISATANEHFEKLMGLIGRSDLPGAEGMRWSAERKKRERAYEGDIGRWVGSLPSAAAVKALEELKIPCGIVRTAKEVFDDQRLIDREMLVRFEQTVLDNIPMLGNPIKLSETPVAYRRSAMERGCDNIRAYQSLLGLSAEEIAGLTAQGVF